jgi:hypothetical protein
MAIPADQWALRLWKGKERTFPRWRHLAGHQLKLRVRSSKQTELGQGRFKSEARGLRGHWTDCPKAKSAQERTATGLYQRTIGDDESYLDEQTNKQWKV